MGRGIKHVRLGGRHARARTFEALIDTKMVEGRKRCTQHRRRGPIATQLFHLLLARGSRESEFHEWLTEVDRNMGLVSGLARTPCGSHPLLFPHLLERQASTDRNDIEDRMRWVGWHSQLMNSFPRSNADLRWIELGTLLGQFLASLFRALIFFASEAFGGIYQVACTGCHHVSMESRFSSDAGGPRRGFHRIDRAPAPR